MSSKIDVYALCPCGSGKKIKFCCHTAILEMERIARLHENGQLDQALQGLDKIDQKHPGMPIVAITRIQLLMETNRFDEAAAIARDMLREAPDNVQIIALHALARLLDVGFQEARPEIHRAFQMCQHGAPDMLASLAAEIADEIYDTSVMSSREHLALALRLTTEAEERQRLLKELMDLDGDGQVPYPLRGAHHLEPVKLDGDVAKELQKDIKLAQRLSNMGCWEIAAKLFLKLSESLPDNWVVWKNIGLCRAWDAEHESAAEALHKAAELAPDMDSAVECETIAQLLELPTVEDHIEMQAARLRLKSIDRAVERIDGCDRLYRLSQVPEMDESSPQVIARCLLLDHPMPEGSSEDKPQWFAEVSVFEMPDEAGTGVMSVIAPEGEMSDRAVALIRELFSAELDTSKDQPDADSRFTVRMVLKEVVPSIDRTVPVPGHRAKQPRAEYRAKIRNFASSVWAQTPLQRLGGRTPSAAAQDESLRVKVAAAIHVLESVSDSVQQVVDLPALRQSLGLPPESVIEVTPETSLNTLTVMQMHRLNLEQLDLDQIGHIINRALLIGHRPFMYRVLTTLDARHEDTTKVIAPDVFLQAMVQVCRETGRHEEAVKWVVAGREHADQADDFNARLNWTMREFQCRVEDLSDPELPVVIDRMWNYFGRKLPGIREAMRPLLKDLDIQPPADAAASSLVLPDGSSGAE